jgi:hypothetical protein
MNQFGTRLHNKMITGSAAQIGWSARDYLQGFPWLAGPGYGPTRERLSVCLFIGTGGMHVRICR